MNKILVFFLTLVAFGCADINQSTNYKMPVISTSFVLAGISDDVTYGYTEENPIKVGGSDIKDGPRNEQMYLAALLGPNGESITYSRLGSCCSFETPNGILGGGLLDKYEINYRGLVDPIILYINMYDSGELNAPSGFTL